MCEKSSGDNSGILGVGCETLRREYVKVGTYLYLVFLCISRVLHSVFLIGVYPVLVVLHVSQLMCILI